MNAHISTVWVWEQLGRCEGTFSPTPNPINAYDDLGGCFCEYNMDETYAAGDKVSLRKDGVQVIYQCRKAPNDQWCGMIVSISKLYSLLYGIFYVGYDTFLLWTNHLILYLSLYY